MEFSECWLCIKAKLLKSAGTRYLNFGTKREKLMKIQLNIGISPSRV